MKKMEWVGGFYFLFFIPGPYSEDANHSQTRKLTLTTIIHLQFLQVKSVFSKFLSPVVSDKVSTSKFFIWSEFLGVGADENLIINFLWPNC